MEYESHLEKLRTLIEWDKKDNSESSRNEATTRFHLIDALFFECLDWDKSECKLEEQQDGTFTDYTFFNPHRCLIIEAKKEGIYFELPSGIKSRKYKISSIKKFNTGISYAIDQAIDYCQKRGVSAGLVCNGHQLICFIGSRNDGISAEDGYCLVFSSLDEILNDFLLFWQTLSKNGIKDKKLERELSGINIPVLPSKLSSKIFEYPGMKGRNSLQADLQILSDLILEELIKNEEIEDVFLKETYCSSGALSQYALVSKTVLQNRYSLLYDKKVDGPATEPAYTKKGLSPELSVKNLSTRPILLIGDVGTGKSIFIKHFMKVEAKEMMSQSIPVYIDLGTKAAFSTDLKKFFLDEISNILLHQFSIDIEERSFVKGVYHLELERFEKGIYGNLKSTNPTEFIKKEIDFLQDKIINRETHIKNSLNHIAKGRLKQIIIFMDNVDQRDEKIQEDAFFIAQEIAANWAVTVFLTIRPQTYYKSKTEGALTGYHPKAFTIAPPRVDEVIQKRLNFAVKIANGELKLKCLKDNVSIRSHNLLTYLEILKNSFNQNSELIEFVENISYGNIRQALELITCFIGSGHVDTEKIFNNHRQNVLHYPFTGYIVALHEFLRAIIFGDHEYYYPPATPIFNMFEVTQNDPKEHFLSSIIIDYISSTAIKSQFGGFVDTKVLVEYCQNLGFNLEQISSSILRLLKSKLLESEARKTPMNILDLPHTLRSTTIGAYHVQRLLCKFSYVDAIIVDTQILDKSIKDRILDCSYIMDRLGRAEIFKNYLDTLWNTLNLQNCGFNWIDYSRILTNDIINIKGKNQN